MKKMKKALALLLAMMLVLTACGSEPGASTTQGNNPGSETTAPGTNAEPVHYKESITIGTESGITTLDCHVQSNTTADRWLNCVHQRLVNFNQQTMTPEPALATEWTWVSPTVLEMKLRENVKFHNGEMFTSDDVIFSFERGIEKGGGPASVLANVKVEAVDDYKIRLTLDTPNVDLLADLALSAMSIMNREAVEADDLNGPGIGVGAWKVKTFVANDYLELTRNEDYYGEIPVTKTLTFRCIPEASARLIALETGEIDVCCGPSNSELEYIKENPDLDLVQYAATSTMYIAFDTSEAPGNDRNLRLAIAYALDKQEIVDMVYEGLATPAASNWNPAVFGYDDSIEEYGPNLEKAKEYLAKASTDTITLIAKKGKYVDISMIVQEQCRKAGINIIFKEVDSATLSAMATFKGHEHEAICYKLSWSPYGNYARKPYYPGTNSNRAVLTDERIMELLDKAVGEQDDKVRMECFKQVQQINHDECYYIPICYEWNSQGIRKGLEGVIWNPNNSHDFTYIRLAE